MLDQPDRRKVWKKMKVDEGGVSKGISWAECDFGVQLYDLMPECVISEMDQDFIRWLFIGMTVVLKKHFGSSHWVLCCWGTSTSQLSSCCTFKMKNFLSKPGSELRWLSHKVVQFVWHCTHLFAKKETKGWMKIPTSPSPVLLLQFGIPELPSILSTVSKIKFRILFLTFKVIHGLALSYSYILFSISFPHKLSVRNKLECSFLLNMQSPLSQSLIRTLLPRMFYLTAGYFPLIF